MEIMTNQTFRKTLKWMRALLIIGIIFFIIVLIGAFSLYLYGKTQGPPPLQVPQTSIFYGADNTIIGESHNGQNRYWIPLTDVSDPMVAATVSVEDRKFFEHHGFDYIRIVAAVIADIKAMAKVQGASTITQQYARNLYLEHNKTWTRKFKEALYTVRLEMNYSKNQILEGYLNTIYYGHGAYGIEAAANYYFDKHAKDLTLGEASMLAGIPKAPSYYSPIKDLERAKSRQKTILNMMIENGYISEKQATTAYEEKLVFVKDQKIEQNNHAPYFLDEVKEVLAEKTKIDERSLEMGGLKIYTTLDPNLQRIAEEQVEKVIDPDSTIQTALMSMDPVTGHVRALVGGRDYKESSFNRATQARRMPGSSFKPFLYYMALENGFTPSTKLMSEPTEFQYDDGKAVYNPHNYNSYYANDFITMAQALALSDNIFAVKTNMFLGPENLAETARRFGIDTDLPEVPSLALGTASVKMINMVESYSKLANGGKAVEPVFITRVEDHQGNVIYENKQKHEQVLDPKLAFVTTHMMTGMFDEKLNDYTTVTGRTIADELTRPYAGKSGTTERDNWMVGFSPQLVTAVWVGYDRGNTIDKVAEKRYSKEIWANYMESAHEALPVIAFRPPDGVVGRYVNPDNGLLATKDCPVQRLTYYVKGTEPTEYCKEHVEDEKEIEVNEKENMPKEDDDGWFKKILKWF